MNYLAQEAKHMKKKAKVMKKLADGVYEVGFRCPDCASGYVTTSFKSNIELTEGDVIEVQIKNITFTYAPKVELVQEEPDFMPDIVKEAQEAGLITDSPLDNTQNMIHPPGSVQSMVVQHTEKSGFVVLGKYDPYIPPHPPRKGKPKPDDELIKQKFMYKLEDKDGNAFVGMTEKEIEVDTLADEDTFEKIAKAHPMHNFTLLHHWWGNAEQWDHYDLFIDTDPITQLVFQKNPLKETEFKAQQREPYSEDFMARGEELEEIAPGEPGNPSKKLTAKVERVDTGKIAIYENEETVINDRYGQPHGAWLASVEFFGQKMEGRWSLQSTVPRIWDVLKETVKLSEEFPVALAMGGDINGFKETPDGLKVWGTAISFGVWNGMYWSPDVIKASPLNDFDNLVIDVEHDRSRASGAVTHKELKGTDIYVEGLITDYETIEKIKRKELRGFSIDAMVFGDPIRRMVTRVKQYKRLTVCANPACKVCYLGNSNTCT